MRSHKVSTRTVLSLIIFLILIIFTLQKGLADDPNHLKWTFSELISDYSSSDSFDPSMAVDRFDNVHVVWVDGTDYNGAGTDPDIFYSLWNATSRSWNAPTVISTMSTDYTFNPSIAVDSLDNIHVAWEDATDYNGAGTDYDIFYTFWNATSLSWNTTIVISSASNTFSLNPSLAVDSLDNIHLAWDDRIDYNGAGTDADIFYTFWNATSLRWNTTSVISSNSTGGSGSPSIAIDSFDNIHVAWNDVTDYNGAGTDPDIFYSFWNATSRNWNTTTLISPSSNDHSIYPSIATDSFNNIHIAWQDRTDYNGAGTDYDIFYSFWNATSRSWNTSTVVSSISTAYSQNPTITVDSLDNIHFAWDDYTDYKGEGADRDIFYTFWNTATQSWDTIIVISTSSTDYSQQPSIAADSFNNIHLVWRDRTDYNGAGTDYDIFYSVGLIPSEITKTETITNTESITKTDTVDTTKIETDVKLITDTLIETTVTQITQISSQTTFITEAKSEVYSTGVFLVLIPMAVFVLIRKRLRRKSSSEL